MTWSARSIAAALIALAGCSNVRQTMRGWVGETQPAAAAHAGQSAAYYAAADQVAVYAQASASSKVVGHLPLNARVSRTQLERGYAYVTADGGLQGWVDAGQLVRRRTAASGATSGAEPTPAEADAPKEAGGVEKAADVEPVPAAESPGPAAPPAPPTPPPPPAPTAAPAVKTRPAPAIEDPF